MKRIHLIVSGIVQGVGFRHHTKRNATANDLTGFVRNMPDGSVEIEAQGTPEALERLIQWAHHGPPSANVDHIAENEVPILDAENNFEIR